MRRFVSRHWRRYAITTVIAVAPIAIMAASVTNLLVPTSPLPRMASYQVVETAAINTSSTTIGLADSDLFGKSDADIIKSLDEMQSLGVNTVRVLIPWAAVQPYDPKAPAPFGNYTDWSKVDFIVNQAMSRNMAVLGVLNSTPYWGGQNGTGCLGCYGVAPHPTNGDEAGYDVGSASRRERHDERDRPRRKLLLLCHRGHSGKEHDKHG